MLILGTQKFIEAPFDSEAELEGVVRDNFEHLFGPSSIYMPKSLIKTKDGFGTIPDGYAIDIAARQWYVVEAELGKHSVWNHIAPQVSKQLIATLNPVSKQLLVELVVNRVQKDAVAMEKFVDEDVEVINIRGVLGEIFETEPIVGLPIDRISSDLSEWAKTLKYRVKLWVVRKHVAFNDPSSVVYEIPEEFKPALDTEEADDEGTQQARYDVSVADLVEDKVLTPGQRLVMTWKPKSGEKKEFEAKVTAAGELSVLGKDFASPSYAAVYAFQSAGGSRTTENGWTKWKTEQGVMLATLREQYLNNREKNEKES